MKVFITKYALTTGIIEKEVTPYDRYPDMVTVTSERWGATFKKPYWYETKEEAINHCEELRVKKLQSLDKQIKKISKIKF